MPKPMATGPARSAGRRGWLGCTGILKDRLHGGGGCRSCRSTSTRSRMTQLSAVRCATHLATAQVLALIKMWLTCAHRRDGPARGAQAAHRRQGVEVRALRKVE